MLNCLKVPHLSVLILLAFLSFNAFAQESDFVFDKTLNQTVVKKEGKSPYVFELLSEKFTVSGNQKFIKRLTTFYKKTLMYKDIAQADSARIVELKRASLPVIDLNETDVNYRLKVYRRTLKRAQKYEYIPVTSDSFYKLKIRRNIFKPENVIVGKFKALGLYYVVKNANGLTESNLISVEEAKEIHLPKESLLFEDKFAVIQNMDTKIFYMVFPEFLSKYSLKDANKTKT